MGGVAALLAVKIALAFAAGAGRIVRAVLRVEALHRGPRRDLRAVDREMLVRQQSAQFLVIHQCRTSKRLRFRPLGHHPSDAAHHLPEAPRDRIDPASSSQLGHSSQQVNWIAPGRHVMM